MTAPEIKLDLMISEAGSDDERLDDITSRLMRDLRALGVESVERPSGGTLPEGAMGDPVTLGALAVVVLPTLIPELLKFLRDYTGMGADRKVKLKTSSGMEIEFTRGRRFSDAKLVALIKELAKS